MLPFQDNKDQPTVSNTVTTEVLAAYLLSGITIPTPEMVTFASWGWGNISVRKVTAMQASES